jgi:hypothetical protein
MIALGARLGPRLSTTTLLPPLVTYENYVTYRIFEKPRSMALPIESVANCCNCSVTQSGGKFVHST